MPRIARSIQEIAWLAIALVTVHVASAQEQYHHETGYTTYIGSGNDMVRSLTLGSDGRVYLVGNTSSPDFPATPGACQPTSGGGSGDAFIMKLVP